jgi:outer membrane protein
MNKKLSITVTMLFLTVAGFSQQITRFAVVDLSKVYTAFYRESKAVRDFEEKSAQVQGNIDRITKEIQELKSRQVNAELAGDSSTALRYENDAYKRSEFLRDYYSTKTAELERDKKNLLRAGSFLEQVYSELQLVAESEGYSMVLNLNNSDIVLWYSMAVDITDKVIQSLLLKAGRARN